MSEDLEHVNKILKHENGILKKSLEMTNKNTKVLERCVVEQGKEIAELKQLLELSEIERSNLNKEIECLMSRPPLDSVQ